MGGGGKFTTSRDRAQRTTDRRGGAEPPSSVNQEAAWNTDIQQKRKEIEEEGCMTGSFSLFKLRPSFFVPSFNTCQCKLQNDNELKV
ncbi:hypothetical protein CRUP_030031 [Coryphaenoides rupestris]|nr:hypothetical protein CRUP_030031 [Coryphaenoides rupestris]